MGLFGNVTDAFGITSWGEQEEAMRRAREYFEGIALPEQRALELERLVKVGELTPQMAETILMESSAFEEIRTDPKLKEAQYEALMGLQERAEQGLTASDRYELDKIRAEEQTAERGSREAIIQQEAMKGRAGGGLEQMSKMINSQESATRQAQRDAQVAALAQEQKMAALMQSGQLGGQMREQEFGEQAKIAQAKDLMDQFNVANQQKTEYMNVGALNAAQEAELAERRKVAAANVALANQERLHASGQSQQQFSNQMALAGGQAGVQAGYADMLGQQSQSNVGMGAGIAAAIAASDVRAKQDIAPADLDIDQFLNEITGYKYNYKDPEKHGKGRRLGVMAQDLEKSPMGETMVSEMEDGVKGIDSTKALHAVLASVGRLNDKIQRLEEKDEL